MRKRRFAPPHPGATLRTQFLDDYMLNAEDFASAIGVQLERVERVLDGQEPLDADLALRLAKLFGGSADGWLHWQQGYDLWLAHGRISEELDVIVPLDPETRLSVREDDPLDPELVEELQRRLADIDDPRRWVVVSNIGIEEVPLHEESLSRMFYDVERNSYCMDLLGATPFKSLKVAETVAGVLGDRMGVVELTKEDLEKPQRDEATDLELRERFLKRSGVGMSTWDIGTYLRGRVDMVAYLEAAAEDGNRELITVAVADVMKAITEQTTSEYLEARGTLGDRTTYEAALDRVRDVAPEEGDE